MEAFSFMATLFGMFPFLKTAVSSTVAFKDRNLRKGFAKFLPHLSIEIVKRSDQVSGFVVLPKRWIVERNHCMAQSPAEGSPRMGKPQPKGRSRSCASPQSASCSENSAIRPEVSGRTLTLQLPFF